MVALEPMTAKTKSSKALPTPEPVTPAEMEQAVKALTREDTERLRQYAANRIQRIDRAANGRSHDDLMQEALFRLLDDRRHWDRKIPFAQCFMGIIQSIASEWAGHRHRNQGLPEYAQLECDLAKTDDEGNDSSPFQDLAEPSLNVEQMFVHMDADAEREAEDKALVLEIETIFAGDEKAGILILGLEEGMDAPTIRAEFGLSEQEFKTTMRRIRYAVDKIMEKRNGR